MAGILSLEFLVHAWDYATAIGRPISAPESLSQYVIGLAERVITPATRGAPDSTIRSRCPTTPTRWTGWSR